MWCIESSASSLHRNQFTCGICAPAQRLPGDRGGGGDGDGDGNGDGDDGGKGVLHVCVCGTRGKPAIQIK